MTKQEMRDRILEVLGTPGMREPVATSTIAARMGIHWTTAPQAYEDVGRVLSQLKKEGVVVLVGRHGWRLT